jgi:hypothetical protein
VGWHGDFGLIDVHEIAKEGEVGSVGLVAEEKGAAITEFVVDHAYVVVVSGAEPVAGAVAEF